MKKQGLIDRMAEMDGISRSESKKRLETLLFLIRDSIVVDGEVALTGIGKIKVVQKPGREVRNPKNGEKSFKEASRGVKFSPSSVLKADVQS